MQNDARLPPSHIALQLWQRRRLRRRLGTEPGGLVALMPCHRGGNCLPPTVFHTVSSLWLSAPCSKVSPSLPPPTPFSGSTSRRSQLADELSRWGTQHKEMSHPLTQTVRCCYSFPRKFAQALWEGGILLSFPFGSQVSRSGAPSRGDAGTAWAVVAGSRFLLGGVRCLHCELRTEEPTSCCCIPCGSLCSPL